MKRIGVALAFAAAMIFGSTSAFAYRVAVHYDGTNAPITHSPDAMYKLITLALREWEAHSDGRVHWQNGLPTTDWPRGPGNITVYWDPTLDDGFCAQTNVFCPNGFHACTIALNPNIPLRSPYTVPARGEVCLDIYATLMHELAHNFNQTACVWPWDCHPENSAVSDLNDDFAVRHLWNFDMRNVNWTIYNQVPVRVAYTTYDPARVAFRFSTTSAASDEFFNFTHAIAPGTRGRRYARAFALGSSHAVVVDQGDFFGRSALDARTPIPGAATSRKVCLASNLDNGHMLAAWASDVEVTTPSGVPPSPIDGSRPIEFSLSQDGGVSWSPAAAVGGSGLTRAGVSCAYDRRHRRFVLVFQGAADERLWEVHRVADDSGVWSVPAALDAREQDPRFSVFTPEAPQVTFDATGLSSSGIVSWFNVSTLLHVAELVTFDGSTDRYQFVPPPSTPHLRFAGGGLRSRLIPVVVPNEIHYAFDVHRSPGTELRLRRETPAIPSWSFVFAGTTPEWIRHNDAATSSLLNEHLFVSHVFAP